MGFLKNVGTAPEIGHFSRPARILRWLIPQLGIRPKVIEIGTGYGSQLVHFASMCSTVVCVDAMYGWVPDIQEAEGFDPRKVDSAKMDAWRSATADFSGNVRLVLGNSFEVHRRPDAAEMFSGADIIIIDGCHHPASSVANDYINYFPFLADVHYAIFDDVHDSDCRVGCGMAQEWLRKGGHDIPDSAELEAAAEVMKVVKCPAGQNGVTPVS